MRFFKPQRLYSWAFFDFLHISSRHHCIMLSVIAINPSIHPSIPYPIYFPDPETYPILNLLSRSIPKPFHPYFKVPEPLNCYQPQASKQFTLTALPPGLLPSIQTIVTSSHVPHMYYPKAYLILFNSLTLESKMLEA